MRAGLPANTLAKSNPPAGEAGGKPGLPIAAPSGRTPLEAGPVAMPPEEAYPFAAARYLAAFCDLIKSIPPGARWITGRPNGPGTEGHAVLIQPAVQGAYRVIGGAGGKLNHHSRASAGGEP
jgi:hypothetical protein